MRLFGEKIGIAFQIKDDMFDFGTDDVGKPLGIDIKEKKVTLPLIYALNNSDSSEKKRMIQLVKNHNDDSKKITEIINFVKQKGGLEYSETQMKKYLKNYYDLFLYSSIVILPFLSFTMILAYHKAHQAKENSFTVNLIDNTDKPLQLDNNL